MRYDIRDLAKKPNEQVYLMAWLNTEDNAMYFEISDRFSHYRCLEGAFSFIGNTTTVHVHPVTAGEYKRLDYDLAKKAAIAYVTGNCVRIDIDLADRS